MHHQGNEGEREMAVVLFHCWHLIALCVVVHRTLTVTSCLLIEFFIRAQTVIKIHRDESDIERVNELKTRG